MVVDAVTVRLLGSVLGTSLRRKLFTTIAGSRIAEMAELKRVNPDTDISPDLDALKDADLIGIGKESRYYVTAKGLQVARDLQKIG